MALLSAAERRMLNLSPPAYALTNFAQHLADASAFQYAGCIATGHIRLIANPQEADTLVVMALPVMHDERWYRGSGGTYCFTSSGTAPAGQVPVVIGATVDASAVALTRAMRGQQSHFVRAWDSR